MNPTRVYVIAEAGVNHNGSLEMAMQLIDVAVDAGADAVKFQTFRAHTLVTRSARKAAYQEKLDLESETQYDMIKRLELDEAAHTRLIDYCRVRGIQFLSTPFDVDSVDLLARKFDLPRLKLSSGDLTNAPILLEVARTGKPLIISTGMSTLGEVEAALGVLAFGYTAPVDSTPCSRAFQAAYCSQAGQAALKEKVAVLHCTTEYPAPFADVNLRAMDTLALFGLPVGLSDHTVGIEIPIAAVARGARFIEKHFTLDRTLPGPDHAASLEPAELKAMVSAIHNVEKALGSPLKAPAPSEVDNMKVARKSLVAAAAIRKDELFTTANLTVKRPGTGVSAMLYFDYLGKPALHHYEQDEVVGE